MMYLPFLTVPRRYRSQIARRNLTVSALFILGFIQIVNFYRLQTIQRLLKVFTSKKPLSLNTAKNLNLAQIVKFF